MIIKHPDDKISQLAELERLRTFPDTRMGVTLVQDVVQLTANPFTFLTSSRRETYQRKTIRRKDFILHSVPHELQRIILVIREAVDLDCQHGYPIQFAIDKEIYRRSVCHITPLLHRHLVQIPKEIPKEHLLSKRQSIVSGILEDVLHEGSHDIFGVVL